MCVGRVVSGSAFLYFAVPCIILFREKHLRPAMVDKADYINAGASRGVARRGAPHAFGAILFNPARRRVAFAQRAAAGRPQACAQTPASTTIRRPTRRRPRHPTRRPSRPARARHEGTRGDLPAVRGNYSRRVRLGGTAPSQAARAGWQYPAA
jgi:hypothetical protein